MRGGPTAQMPIVVGSSTATPQQGNGTRETRHFGSWRPVMRSAYQVTMLSRGPAVVLSDALARKIVCQILARIAALLSHSHVKGRSGVRHVPDERLRWHRKHARVSGSLPGGQLALKTRRKR